MNTQEIKDQAHKEFDKEFGIRTHHICEGFTKCVCNGKYKSFIDSLIDRTVQMERERILHELESVVKHNDYIEMKSFLYVNQIKNLIEKDNV